MDEYTPDSPQELERALRVLKVPDTYHPIIFSLIGGNAEYLSFITESDLATAAVKSDIVLPTPVARGIIYKLVSYGGASAPPPPEPQAMTNNASSAQPMFQVRCNTAAAFSAEGRHNAKVQALLADEIFSNRLLFGRNNAQQPLSDHEIACNTAATRLLCDNYRLVRWDGASIRTGVPEV